MNETVTTIIIGIVLTAFVIGFVAVVAGKDDTPDDELTDIG